MDIRQLVIFVLLVLMIAFNVLLGLFILVRALTTIVRNLRSVKGQTANGADRGENVEFEMRRTRRRRRWQNVAFVDSARISARPRPEPAGVKAKAAISGDAEPRARSRDFIL